MSTSKKVTKRSKVGTAPTAKTTKSKLKFSKTASAQASQLLSGKNGTRISRRAVTKRSGPRESSKLATIITMLRGPKGTTIEAMMRATGWQGHSLRGALAGSIKKKLGLTLVSEKTGGVRTYRIAD